MLLTLGFYQTPLGLFVTLGVSLAAWYLAWRVGARRGHRRLGFWLGFLFGWLGLAAVACVRSTEEARVARRAEQLRVEQAARERLERDR